MIKKSSYSLKKVSFCGSACVALEGQGKTNERAEQSYDRLRGKAAAVSEVILIASKYLLYLVVLLSYYERIGIPTLMKIS